MSIARLTRVLRQHLRRQEQQALAALKAGTPFPAFDAEAMTASLEPLLLPTFLRGARRAARDIGGKVRGRTRPAAPVSRALAYGLRPAGGGAAAVRKRDVSFASRLFRALFPRAAEAVRRLTLTFCRETNAASRRDLIKARQTLRDELDEGLEQGEALAKLTARVRRIFATPRAYDIARTESARAVEAGGMLAARESGVVRAARWLTAPQSCDRCRALDGKEVPLGTPFVVLPGGGPYAVVYHPGLHPNCRCTTEYVVEERYR